MVTADADSFANRRAHRRGRTPRRRLLRGGSQSLRTPTRGGLRRSDSRIAGGSHGSARLAGRDQLLTPRRGPSSSPDRAGNGVAGGSSRVGNSVSTPDGPSSDELAAANDEL